MFEKVLRYMAQLSLMMVLIVFIIFLQVVLWNATIATLFEGARDITFWKMAGIDLILGLLFGSDSSIVIKVREDR